MKRIHGLLRWRAQKRRLLLMRPPVICDLSPVEPLCEEMFRPGAVVVANPLPRFEYVYPPRRPEVRMT